MILYLTTLYSIFILLHFFHLYAFMLSALCIHCTRCFIKKEPLYFQLNSHNSWSIFTIFAPVETGMNTPQYV